MLRVLVALLLALPALAKDCIPFDQALDHIGKTMCVTGKVLKVGQSRTGSLFLDFCDDYRKCSFVVFVYQSSLKNIGDVRVLEGQTIEITGKIKEWDDRAEIILKNRLQLEGMTEKLPQVPATYDAAKHGSYSAGKYSSPRSKHPAHRRNTQPADEIDAE
jgi:hypothetical protein